MEIIQEVAQGGAFKCERTLRTAVVWQTEIIYELAQSGAFKSERTLRTKTCNVPTQHLDRRRVLQIISLTTNTKAVTEESRLVKTDREAAG